MRSPYYPYPPRPGTLGPECIDTELSTGTNRLLSPEQIEGVINFEHQLYNACLDPELYVSSSEYIESQQALGFPMQPLETIWSKKIDSRELGINYFETDEGRLKLFELTGNETENNQQIINTLCSMDLSVVDSDQLSSLVAKSIGYEEEILTKSFIENGFEGSQLEAPQILTVYKNPEVILEKARGYRQHRTFLSRVNQDLADNEDSESPENRAKMLITSLYSQRVNSLLAASYITAYKFLSQQKNSSSMTHQELVNELGLVLPAFAPDRSDSSISSFLQRIDRFRYGVAFGEDNKYSWLSPQARDLYEKSKHKSQNEDTSRFMYEQIDPMIFDEVEVDGSKLGNWISHILEEYEFLSEESSDTWTSDRPGPAQDGKWQVIVSDEFKSLEVQDRQRCVYVPMGNRSLRDAVKLTNHEITHVFQPENKRIIGGLAILERIGIDTALEQSEAGGKWQEKVAEEIVTGKLQTEIAGTGYLMSLLVKENGGSFGDIVSEYHKDLLERNPQKDAKKLAKQAVNRARRIFRHGGIEFAQSNNYLTNTQPLHYLEQQLIYDSLDEEHRKYLLIGGVTIPNLVQLSRQGLVDTNDIFVPEKKPWELLFPMVVEYLGGIEK
jgi:hypothetical protein